MSLVEAEEVPEARSFCSISSTRMPRPAASRAMPTPLMPPPMMARSKSAMARISLAGAWRELAGWLKPTAVRLLLFSRQLKSDDDHSSTPGPASMDRRAEVDVRHSMAERQSGGEGESVSLG